MLFCKVRDHRRQAGDGLIFRLLGQRARRTGRTHGRYGGRRSRHLAPLDLSGLGVAVMLEIAIRTDDERGNRRNGLGDRRRAWPPTYPASVGNRPTSIRE